MNVVEALKGVRDKLAEPRRWCQASWACDASGASVDAVSPTATCWCLIGAIQAVVLGNVDLLNQCRMALRAQAGLPDHQTLSGWNDRAVHADVISLLDLSIAAEQSR